MTWTSTVNRGLRRAAAAAMLAVLALSTAPPAQATSGPPDTTYVIYRVRATPGGSTALCAGEILRIRTAVTVKISRIEGNQQSGSEITPGMTGSKIKASVSDPAVGSVSPSSGYTFADDDGPNVEFVFVAAQPGTANLLFEYEASAPPSKYMPSAPTQAGVDPQKSQSAPTHDAEQASQQDKPGLLAPQTVEQATPATVSVEVRACPAGYRITVQSSWLMPGDAPRIRIAGSVDTTAVPDASGAFFAQTTMINDATWIGPCAATITMPPSGVTISGTAVNQGSKPTIELHLEYGPVSSHTVESCAGGTSDSIDTPDPLDLSLPAAGGTTALSHGGTSDARGASVVTVTRLAP